MGLVSRLLGNHVLVNILFVLTLALGVLSYQQMPRAKDPDINFNWISIITPLPGASSLEVEKRVTNPIEDTISQTVRDIRFVSSTSREGVSSILVRFNSLSEDEFDKRIADLRREVQNTYTDKLPTEAKEPEIIEITTSTGFPTAIVVLTGESFDDDLRRYGAIMAKEFERRPGIDQALVVGAGDPELQIVFDPQKIEGLGIAPTDIADTVRGYFRDRSIGDITTANGVWTIQLEGTHGSIAELESFPILSATGVVTLGSIANIYRTMEEPSTLSRYQGTPAIMYSIMKRENVNTLELIEDLNALIDRENETISKLGYRLVLVDDQTVSTREAIDIMQFNALIGLILVFTVCWLFLGFQVSLLTSIGIPFTLAGTFFILNFAGISLNNTVLLAMVIALGMLVDDAVVVVEAIYYRLQRGARAVPASLAALKEVFAPVTTSVLTTIAVFLPLLLLPGILGEFMKIIPIVVCTALAISLVEAFWMLPAHIAVFKINFYRESPTQRRRRRLTRKLRHNYSLLLLKAMRFPGRSLAGVAAILALATLLLFSGALKIQFFASDPLRIFYINVEMPQGTPIYKTLETTRQLELKALAQLADDEIRASTIYAGQMYTQTEPLFGDNIGQVMVSLNPQIKGGRDARTIVQAVHDALGKNYGNAKITVFIWEDGPPIGQPINIKVRGDDFEALQRVADTFVQQMEAIGHYRNINLDFRPGNPEVLVKLNGDAIQRAGLTPDTITRTLQAYVDGEIVTQYQDRGEEVNVRVIANDKGVDRSQVDRLFSQTLATADGRTIALGELVSRNYTYGQKNIRHYNYLRTITIAADIDEEAANTVEANKILEDFWQRIATDHPGINVDFSGELDDIKESLSAIALLFVIGLGLIYLLLGTQFRSYWQPLMVLVAVPLAFTGVVLGLYITKNPMSLYTLYGVVALSGIAVNASIVLISAANSRVAAGMSVLHATVYAARRRVVPILITSLTTIAGLFSLAAGFAGRSLVWGPVATAIVSGLFFSTALTLFVVPLLYRTIESTQWAQKFRQVTEHTQ